MRRLVLMLTIMVVLVSLLPPGPLAAQRPQISVVTVRGSINPVSADYLVRNLAAANRRGDRLFLVEMDTPGGLDSAMRQAVQAVLASRVPVAVLVTPAGARAASAGAVIALAADICAMSPGTNLGAAHPVTLGGKPDQIMEQKVVNDAAAYLEGIAAKRGRNQALAREMATTSLSLSAERALSQQVIDLVALDRQDLVRRLEGRRLVRDGEEQTLRLAGVQLVEYPMGARDRILNAISNPDLAYLLMLAGILGLFFELSTPGVILPGVIGAISLLLAFFAFQTLPVNYAGVLLILLAGILLIAEVTVVSHGILAIGAIISLVLGSLLLFPGTEPQFKLSWWVMGLSVSCSGLLAALIVSKGVAAYRQRPITGTEGMLGEQGIAETDLAPEGKVRVRGEYWNAVSSEPIAKGDRVEITAVTGLRLTVRKTA